MPVYKRKYRSGKVAWYYQFALPGSTRQNQNLVNESGFATKQEATDAEAVRRTEELVRQAATGGVAAPMPTTLAMLLADFMKQHVSLNYSSSPWVANRRYKVYNSATVENARAQMPKMQHRRRSDLKGTGCP